MELYLEAETFCREEKNLKKTSFSLLSTYLLFRKLIGSLLTPAALRVPTYSTYLSRKMFKVRKGRQLFLGQYEGARAMAETFPFSVPLPSLRGLPCPPRESR